MYIPVTIEENIENIESAKISHRSLNSVSFIKNIKSEDILKIPFNPIYNKYKDFFDKVTVDIPLTEEEQKKYRYSPKRVSLDMYGTVHYWSIILYINDSPSVIDFTPERLRIVYNDRIEEVINEIMILNRK